MHYALGAAVFVFIGFRFVSRGKLVETQSSVSLTSFITGCALLGAGIASRWGDRFWIGDDYRVIPPDGVDHDRITKALSYSSMTAGIVLMIAVLALEQ